jgi:hypothetical protein
MDIREIARRAKVSTATVSRMINHIPTVDSQLAKRVRKAVDELGYYPNTQARALVSDRSRIFGLIVSEITNPSFPEIVRCRLPACWWPTMGLSRGERTQKGRHITQRFSKPLRGSPISPSVSIPRRTQSHAHYSTSTTCGNMGRTHITGRQRIND